MPIYEYACKSCNHTLDALQKLSDEPLVDCPECGKPELRKMLSAPRFRLKGEGWYETDFKKEKQKNLLKNDSEPAKSDDKSDSKSGDKSDNKSDSKSDSKDKSDTAPAPANADKSGKPKAQPAPATSGSGKAESS